MRASISRHQYPPDDPRRLTSADDQNGARAECLVDALCLDLDHCQPLNLLQLAAQGYLDVSLIGLPLKCGACGSRRYRVIVARHSYRM
jgi:hypothetical protein